MEIIIGVAVVFVLGWLIPSPTAWFAHRKERRKLEHERQSLREHLHTKMEIDAKGLEQLKDENEKLRQATENLRATVHNLKAKPGRREIQLLHVYDNAIEKMKAQAPGFAPVWQHVLAEAQNDLQKTDKGLKAYIKKVFPSPDSDKLSSESLKQLNNQQKS